MEGLKLKINRRGRSRSEPAQVSCTIMQVVSSHARQLRINLLLHFGGPSEPRFLDDGWSHMHTPQV